MNEPKEMAMDYRVVNDNGWQVQKMIDGKWETVWFCQSEESANKRFNKCIVQSKEWAKLTAEERQRRILR